MAIFRCKNQVVTFNNRSAELKALAIADGMQVTGEWKNGEFECFQASHTQARRKAGNIVFAECGANVNGNPYVWHTVSLGFVVEHTYLQK